MPASDASSGPNRAAAKSSGKDGERGEKAERPSRSALGEALRANLRRRKDQARARRGSAEGAEPEGGES